MKKLIAVLAGTLVATGALAGTATGSPIVQNAVVSADPANFTPRVTANANGTKTAVYKMTQVGGTMFAGGEFTEVQNAARTTTYSRANLFSFNPTTGDLTPFSVNLNGSVWAIVSDGTSLYVGGTFTTVNGVARRGLVKLNPTTGAVDTAFDARLSGAVREAAIVSGRLIIGGEFTKRLQAVDLATGADTGYLDLAITGDVDGTGSWAPRVYRFAINPAGTRLVAVGNFLTVNGATRARAFMVDLGATSGTLSPWYYAPLQRSCAAASILDYLRDVDFSPDGSYFVIVSSGFVPAMTGHIGTSLCDAAARFETGNLAPAVPTWINYTGGDTLQATTVTTAAVYVQGHNRWLDNPNGRDTCETTCVSRPGIGAIDPTTGRALAWNPTKTRAEGGKDLLLTNQGLWVPSDGTVIGGETRERLALMPAQATPPGNVAPSASFTSSCAGLTCSFTDTSSDSDGSIASWRWNFGDGSTSTARNPQRTYAAAGTYTVTLQVTDNAGATSSATRAVTVQAPTGINLSATGYKVKGEQAVDLTWSGAAGASIDVVRDGTKIATTANDGAFTDNIGAKGGAQYRYRVCEAGTTTCSNTVTVTF